MTQRPEEKDIERLLFQIQPEPDDSLHERMQSAPWNQADTIEFPQKSRYLLRAAATLLITVLLVSLFFNTPVRSVAQQMLSIFFTISPDETREHSFERPEPTATIPAEVIQATVESRRPPIETLAANAFVEIKLPQYLPDGYVYESGYTDESGNVFMTFSFAEGDRVRRFLNIHQGNDVTHGFEIGANAIVQQVSINGVIGEYVQGTWMTEEVTETDGTVNMTTRWNNDTELHFLSWSLDGVSYQIFYQSSLYFTLDDGLPDAPGYLTLDDLIAIADSME